MTADTEPPEVRAYLPAHEAPALRNVQAGSAIVSHHEYVHSPDDPEGPARVLVYFEGNKHGASNMATYADRAMFAYWRMRERYPTVAQAEVPVDQLVRIGTLDPEHRAIELVDDEHAPDLANWLACPPERLRDELHVKSLRP